MFLNIKTHKKGAALYLTIVMMAIVLAIALGLSTIIVGQLKVMRQMGYSVFAFYAADAGIEWILTENYNNPCDVITGGPPPCDNSASPIDLGDGETKYYILVLPPGADCGALNYCVTSVGIYKGVRRAIEITY